MNFILLAVAAVVMFGFFVAHFGSIDDLKLVVVGIIALGVLGFGIYAGVPYFFVNYLEKEANPNHTLTEYCLDKDQSTSHVWYVLFNRHDRENSCQIGHGDNPQNSIRNYILWGTFLGVPVLIAAAVYTALLIAEEGPIAIVYIIIGIVVLAVVAAALLIYLIFWAFMIMIGIFMVAAASSRK